MNKKVLIPAAAVGSLLAVNAVRAAKFTPVEKKRAEIPTEKVNSARVQENLSKAIQCKTISKENSADVNWDEFKKFHKFLEEAYPLVHKTMSKEIISEANLIYIYGKARIPTFSPWHFLLIRMLFP